MRRHFNDEVRSQKSEVRSQKSEVRTIIEYTNTCQVPAAQSFTLRGIKKLENVMKKSFFAVIPALLFASCSFWNEPVEEFFSYWTSEAYVTDSSVKVPNQSDSEGIISVASDKNAEVILNIANPKNFNLVMPSAGNTEMIHFNAFDPQPVFGTDYMIEKLSPKALKLTYTAQFLKKHEWGQKDLGATLTMFADDGREFKKKLHFQNQVEYKTAPAVRYSCPNNGKHSTLCFMFDCSRYGRTG